MKIGKLLCVSTLTPWVMGMPALAADAELESASLEEIIVTAQKREQSVQDIPSAVTALSGEMLADRGFVSAADLQAVVPSMVAGVGTRGETTVTIRGVGYNDVGSPGVAIHVDGVYQPRPGMGGLAQVDVSRVEVLRGPQGTLYGRNANGGVINYIGTRPTDELEGYVLGSYASFDESRVQGTLNVPLGEGFGARLTVDRWERGEGFVENVLPGGQDVGGGESLSGRLAFAWDPSDAVSIDLILTASSRSGPNTYFTLADQPSATSVARNPFFAAAIVPTEPLRTAINDPTTSDREYRGATGIVAWDIGEWTLRSITGFQSFDDDFTADFDGTNLSAFPLQFLSSAETTTQEFNLAGALGPIDTVIGMFYMQDEFSSVFHFDFNLGIFPLGPGSVIDNRTLSYDTESIAYFVDGTWNLTDRLRLIAGLRYSEDRQEILQNNFLLDPPDAIPPNLGFIPTCPMVSNEVNFYSTTPRAGVQYDVSADSNLYATYSEGVKIGGFNYRAGCGDQYESEELIAYEIGWKNSLFNNSLSLNLSAFYYDYSDYQIEQILNLASTIANAPGVEVRGVEVETSWRPDDHWNVFSTLSLLDAEFTEFCNANGVQPGVNVSADCAARGLPGTQDLKGNRVPFTPEVSVNFGASYSTGPVLAGGALTFRGDVSYRSDVPLREFDGPDSEQASYTLVDVSVLWKSPSEAFSVRLFGRNITDEEYYANMRGVDSLGARIVTWGPPRQVGVDLRANF